MRARLQLFRRKHVSKDFCVALFWNELYSSFLCSFLFSGLMASTAEAKEVKQSIAEDQIVFLAKVGRNISAFLNLGFLPLMATVKGYVLQIFIATF